MATVLKIKRSSTANAPATLGQGEVAYSWGSGATNGQRLYIGTGTETGGNAANIEIVGGKYYTDRLKFGGTDFTNGILIGHSTTGTLNNAHSNIGVGSNPLSSITSGDDNIAIGTSAGLVIADGGKNTVIGTGSGWKITSGNSNIGIGGQSLYGITTQSHNIGIGAYSVYKAAGPGNIGIGSNTLQEVVGGEYNIGLGFNAGDNITSGDGNVIIGSINADSATADKQLIIADGVDGSVAWIKGDSSANVTVGGNIHATNIKTEGTNFTGSLLVGHSTTGTLDAATYNTGVGIGALDALTAGDYNTAFGYNAGSATTLGTENTFIGALSGPSSTGASYYNTGIGMSSLYALTTGDRNTGLGRRALMSVSTGNQNTSIGYESGKIITGDGNITLGTGAGDNITSGDGNVIIGQVDAGSATGDKQLIIADGTDGSVKWIDGDSSGNLTFSGKLQSVTDPTSAQDAATKAYVDTAITDENLDFQGDSGGALEIDLDSETLTIAGGTGIDTVGATNTLTVAIDSTVMTGKTEGTNFTGSLLVGHSTTGTLSSALQNTGVGLAALDAITSGDNNTTVGYEALTTNTTGSNNVGLGHDALKLNLDGNENTAIGSYALDSNTSGDRHVAVGDHALAANTTGGYSTGIGRSALEFSTGSYNIALGYQAGDNITSGSGNVVIGKADVSSATGDDQLSISDGEDGSVVWLTGDSAGEVTIPATLTTTVNSLTGVAIPGKSGGTNFTNSLLIGHSTTGTLNASDNNTGVGLTTLDALTSGDSNTAVGYEAGTTLTSANNNTAIGKSALYTSSTGGQNTGLGKDALKLTTGSYNTALGYTAGRTITSGDGNVIIGDVDVDSATGDRQLKIAGYDGSTRTTWISGDSSGNLTFSGKLQSVTDPTAAQDVATKSYVDAVATGLDVKDSVNLATTAALAASTYANGAGTITANANGALSVDSVAVAVDDRILVKNQASALQNGIYKVTATGSAGAVFVLTRTPDADTASEITGGAFTFVEKGTVNADNGYVFTHDGTPTLGSTSITVAQFSGAGQITAGAALLKTNNTLDVRVDDSSIQVTSDALNVKALGVTNAMLAGSIANAKLANSVITVTDGTNSTATALGGTVTFTESEAIDITESSGTVTIAAEVATSANKGVASFNTGNFTVASGDVTVTSIDGGSY